MRLENFKAHEHYHLSDSGTTNEKIFKDDQDKARFIFLITHFQSPTRIYNVSWYTNSFIKKRSFNLQGSRVKTILKERSIRLIAFALTANHFDLLIQNLEDSIASVYMHRILTAYSKYFNAKYHKKGHVFHGPFQALHIKGTELLDFSTHIHQKPNLVEPNIDYKNYPWSSYQDYAILNRWGDLIFRESILKRLPSPLKYKDFIAEKIVKTHLS